MDFETLTGHLQSHLLGHKTLLGVGPVSKNTVDAVLEIANILKIPFQLVATRRQIECDTLSQVYVNSWSTKTFAEYVRERDKWGKVMLVRTSGMWQGEGATSPSESTESAKESYAADIEAGFDVVHLNSAGGLESLLEHCESQSNSEKVLYECGEVSADALPDFAARCSQLNPKIKFVHASTGTAIKGGKNVGSYDPQLARRLVKACNEHGLLLKEHNVDFASDAVLLDHPLAGIHAVNVSAEFGVAETKKFLFLLDKHKMKKEKRRFLKLAYESDRWRKWCSPNASKDDKAILSGHYVFHLPEIQDIYQRLNECSYVDEALRYEIASHILRYLGHFKWHR